MEESVLSAERKSTGKIYETWQEVTEVNLLKQKMGESAGVGTGDRHHTVLT